ncbi:hypothetical protein PUR61_11620 [Streptomyces sp. BE20]|nr:MULTISPECIES: hypothetical protein [unclassified Streptomyces]MED7952583.1 hypothetical protein [Streptomyces sp. BE303]MEE1822838.1 hypothetical protein [Streptomyces sp. BE20]
MEVRAGGGGAQSDTTHSHICQDADPAGLIRLPGPDVDEAPEVVGADL